MRITPILLVVSLTTGCSFYGHGNRDPVQFPSTHSSCRVSTPEPIVDTVLGLAGGALTGLAIEHATNAQVLSTGNAQTDQQNAANINAENWTLIGGAAVFTALYAGSAIYGYGNLVACDDAVAHDALRHEQEQTRNALEVRRQQKLNLKLELEKQEVLQQERETARLEVERKEAIAAATIRAQREECSKTLSVRLLAKQELEHHAMVQAYVNDNCKEVPITHRKCEASAAFGATTCNNVVVGRSLSCKGTRPTKLDGSKMSDQDILDKNYTTNHDDVESWEKTKLSGQVCSQFEN